MSAGHTEVPETAAGHWDTAEGREMAIEYADKPKSWLIMSEVSDFALANAQYLVGRDSLELIHYQTAAKERIRWLSVRLAIAEAALEGRAIEAAEADLLGKALEAARKAKRELENGNGEVMSIIAAMSHLDAILSQVREVRG